MALSPCLEVQDPLSYYAISNIEMAPIEAAADGQNMKEENIHAQNAQKSQQKAITETCPNEFDKSNSSSVVKMKPYNNTYNSRQLPPDGGQTVFDGVTSGAKTSTYYNTPERKTTPANLNLNSNNAKNRTTNPERREPTVSERPVAKSQEGIDAGTYAKFADDDDHYDILPGQINSPTTCQGFTSNRRAHRRHSVKQFLLYLSLIVLGIACFTGAIFGGMVSIGRDFRSNVDAQLSKQTADMAAMLNDSQRTLLHSVKIALGKNQSASDLRVVYGPYCYCLYRQKLSWSDAKEYCLTVGKGVHFAEIYDTHANNVLTKILTNSDLPSGVWLGGSDLQEEGVWRWEYSKKTMELFSPSQWADGEPSSDSTSNTKEDCLELFNWRSDIFKWNDHACNDKKPVLCMSDLVSGVCLC